MLRKSDRKLFSAKNLYKYPYTPDAVDSGSRTGENHRKTYKPKRDHNQALGDAKKCFLDSGEPMTIRDVANKLRVKQPHARALILKLVSMRFLKPAPDLIKEVPRGFYSTGVRKQRILRWELQEPPGESITNSLRLAQPENL